MRPPSASSPTTPARADAGAEGPQHGGDAAGAAEPFLAPVGVQQDDRRFLADALGVAPDVAVEHQVADHQHARLAQTLHQIDQVGSDIDGHAPLPVHRGEDSEASLEDRRRDGLTCLAIRRSWASQITRPGCRQLARSQRRQLARDRRVQQRQQDLVMADQLDALGTPAAPAR